MSTEGEYYEINGDYAYLNTPAVTGGSCFVNILNNQRGYEIANGAAWTLEYTEGKGWSLKNVGTGKYLKDAAHPAMFDEPTYFTFCTLKETNVDPSGIQEVRGQKSVAKTGAYTLDGRRVNAENLRPGLYIMNGKKIVIK